MTNPAQLLMSALNRILRKMFFALAVVCTLTSVGLHCAQAQTFSVLHTFSGGSDGGNPYTGVTLDQSGNLYGTAYFGGSGRCGSVFRLQRRNSGWIFSNLYTFHDSDGCAPSTKVVWGPNGAIYGTTEIGGTDNTGTVFELSAPPHVCATVSCPWTETVLYSFQNAPNAENPDGDPVVFDSDGNLFGATWNGGLSGCDDGTCGTVYELSPSQGGWVETVLHAFPTGNGAFPNGVIVGNDNNLYGTTYYNPSGEFGSVFELSRNNGWSLTNLYTFSGGSDGGSPYAGVITDSASNLYGATGWGGANQAGTVFSISPGGEFSLLMALTNPGGHGPLIGPGPAAKLMMDSAGNLYGTTYSDGAYGYGSVFKMTRSGDGYILTTLHDFTGGSDGAYPISDVVMDAAGNLYGTASVGGSSVGSCSQGAGCGVVWEIMP